MDKKAKMEEEKFNVRYTEVTDADCLKRWLCDPEVANWFPMLDEPEIDHAVNIWVGFSRYKCSLTALYDGVPCGIATLYLQPYKKLAHQCEFGIILDSKYRNRGIGTRLMENLIHLAKTQFKIEILHLQVYAKNPAIRLYERLGFKEFGKQEGFIKENGNFVARIFMEKYLKQ